MVEPLIKTERMVLRPWKEADFMAFARLNADPRVMEYFPGILTQEESDRFAKRICTAMKQQGWGLWAVSVPNVSDFIGYIGLAPVNFAADFTPAVEVGWRLAYDFWNKGYATEGAIAALKYGFETLQMDEIVSFTAIQNKRSQKVMEKIGLTHYPEEDFDHPKLVEGHSLRRHVLYRLKQNEWKKLIIKENKSPNRGLDVEQNRNNF